MNNAFEYINSVFDPALQAATTSLVSSAIAASSTVLTAALSLYIIMWGGLAAWRQVSAADMARACVRAAAVALLCTTAYYGPYIVTMFTQTVPNWINTAVTGNTSTVAQQFDMLIGATAHYVGAIIAQTSPISQIAERICAWALNLGACFVLAIGYGVFKLAQVMVDVLVIIGPLLLFLTLFPATRDIPMRWFHKLVGMMILIALIDIVSAMVIQLDKGFLLQAINAGGGVDVELEWLTQSLIVDAFGVVILVAMIPLATYLAGGIGVPLMGAAAMGSMVGAAVGNAVARVGRVGSSAINRARGN